MIEFVIPWVPPSANDWRRGKGHWSKRHRATLDWMNRVAVSIPRRCSPMWPSGRAITPALVTLTFVNPRKTDPDNRAKLVLDGLVRFGLLADDGPPDLVELRLRSEVGKPAQTRVRIESVAEAGEPERAPGQPAKQ